MAQLENNTYGYSINITLFDSSVQGSKVERDTCEAISQIIDNPELYDAVIILRGGGSRLDLSAYDSYQISKNIALSGMPFIIGIGHEIDQSVVDIVSKLSLKTPTAVADFLLERMLHFESNAHSKLVEITQSAESIINQYVHQLNRSEQKLAYSAGNLLNVQHQYLQVKSIEIKHLVSSVLSKEKSQIERIDQIVTSNDPKAILQKGYAYVSKDGRMVNSTKQVTKGDMVTLTLEDGKLSSEIQ